MESKITYQFANEKEFQEEIERCCENNRNTFHQRRKNREEELSKRDPKELEEAFNIFFRMIKDWKGIE
jgi:hypothetical protein